MTRRLALLLTGALALAPVRAAAWDARATHLGMLDRALVGSALHLRWMAASELQRGLFTPLRVDPARLSPAERRVLAAALRYGGLEALGGPGACPGLGAPPATQRFCVEGDLWELMAVQWLQVGVLAEMVPSARATHHFVDRRDPLRPDFDDPQTSPRALRSRQVRHNGAPTASLAAGTGFSGHGPSVVSWLRDAEDPLAPPQTWTHLELASTLPDPLARSHHLALALIGIGALLHVVQDLAVPAHARGDVGAFFSPLSASPGDRGLPFAELARLSFGRNGLPGARTPAELAAARGLALAPSLAEHLFGGAATSAAAGALVLPPGSSYEGLAVFTARRFLSEASVPAPRFLDEALTPEAAAAELLADSALDPVEVQGARLSPWPAPRGYLQSGTGRPLAAFDTDDEGRVRTYVDEAVYREQFAHLIPRAVEVTRSLLDWTWPAWPEITYDATHGHADFDVAADLVEPVVLVFHQDAAGQRTVRRKLTLRTGERNRLNGLPTQLGEGERTVLLLRARRPTGEPLLLEHVLGAESKVFPLVPAPYVPPPPEPAPEPEPIPGEAAAEAGELAPTSAEGDPTATPPLSGAEPTASGDPPPLGKLGGKSPKDPSLKGSGGPKGQPTPSDPTSPKGLPPTKGLPTPAPEETSPKGQPAPKGRSTPAAPSPTSPKDLSPPAAVPKGQPTPAAPSTPTSPKGQPTPAAPSTPTSPKGLPTPAAAPTSPKGQPTPKGQPAAPTESAPSPAAPVSAPKSQPASLPPTDASPKGQPTPKNQPSPKVQPPAAAPKESAPKNPPASLSPTDTSPKGQPTPKGQPAAPKDAPPPGAPTAPKVQPPAAAPKNQPSVPPTDPAGPKGQPAPAAPKR